MRRIKIFSALFAVAFIIGCTATVTPKGTLAGMYKIYNDQYEDYQKMAADPTTTEAQKEVMRKKKPILDKLGILLPAYDTAVVQGTATEAQRQTITDLLNELGKM